MQMQNIYRLIVFIYAEILHIQDVRVDSQQIRLNFGIDFNFVTLNLVQRSNRLSIAVKIFTLASMLQNNV